MSIFSSSLAKKGVRGSYNFRAAESSNRVTISDSNTLLFQTGNMNFTYEAIVKVNTVSRQTIYDTYTTSFQTNTSNGNFVFQLTVNAKNEAGSTVWVICNSGEYPLSDDWYHVFVTYEKNLYQSQGAKVYVNGALAGTASSYDTNEAYGDVGPYIGYTAHVGGVWGDMDLALLRIYNKALTAEEVQGIYRSKTVPFHLSHGDPRRRTPSWFGNFTADVGGFETSSFIGNVGKWQASGTGGLSRETSGTPYSGSYHGLFTNTYHSANNTTNSVFASLRYGGSTTHGDTNVGAAWGYTYAVEAWFKRYSSSLTVRMSVYGEGNQAIECSVSSSYRRFVLEYVHTHAHYTVEDVYFHANSGDHDFYVDNVKFFRAGLVAEYKAENISDTTWIDTGPHGLHGTVANAKPTNHTFGSLALKNINTSNMNFDGTTTSDALDAYEEGTWTPTLHAHSSYAGTLRVDYATGAYVRIGRLVSIRGNIVFELGWGATVSASLSTWVAGLPFASDTRYTAGGSDAMMEIMPYKVKFDASDYHDWQNLGYIGTNQMASADKMHILSMESGGAPHAWTVNAWTSNISGAQMQFYFSGTYMVKDSGY
tara:strand:+ start:9472 stop:11250 length:1779 start_codon:yes stop_codon:yes gene_type:complete